jgi:hypothetical protein
MLYYGFPSIIQRRETPMASFPKYMGLSSALTCVILLEVYIIFR